MERAGRLTAAAGAVVLFVSLFLTWTAGRAANFLILFGAVNRRGGFFASASRTAWEAYSFADVALAALAVVIVFGARSKRAGVQVVALIAAVAGLGFAIDQIADPPGAGFSLPSAFAHRLPASFAQHVFGSASGSGEGVATVALVVAIAGLVVVLTSRRGVA
jgi:hypothetical protein